jgi:hypothetical protein
MIQITRTTHPAAVGHAMVLSDPRSIVLPFRRMRAAERPLYL